jgi:hypothetical protein
MTQSSYANNLNYWSNLKPELIDHINRSYLTEHTQANNNYLTLAFGGQFIPAKCVQGLLAFRVP